MIAMKSLELDDEDKLDAIMPIPMETKPDFPYGCRICLTEKEFEKLGLDAKDAVIDGMIHGHFMGRITSVSHSESTSGDPCCRVEIQMEALAIESEDEENEEAESSETEKPKRRSLYKD